MLHFNIGAAGFSWIKAILAAPVFAIGSTPWLLIVNKLGNFSATAIFCLTGILLNCTLVGLIAGLRQPGNFLKKVLGSASERGNFPIA